MVNILIIILGLALCVQAFIGLSFFISSIWEKERRASIFGGLQFLGMLVLVVLFFVGNSFDFFDNGVGFWIMVGALIIGVIACLMLFLRIGTNPKAMEGTKGLIVGEVKRFDERQTVFARLRSLRPDSEQYKTLYEEHPEYKAFDDARRARGGLLGRTGAIDSPRADVNVAMTLSSLNIPHYLCNPGQVTPEPHFSLKETLAEKRTELYPEEATERVKGYAKMLGASLVGVTEINPLWLYSRRGEIFCENWEDWGKEIHLEHKYAVVFAEEMSFEMVGIAPHTPTTIESMHKYAKGAYIAVQVAAFIANLGYSATANHLRHYDALMVPLAVDAGLGELGRMGYLITKDFGPRVRLSAVTTNLPLVPDKPVDIGVRHFCSICKKCAVCCPSRSIPMEGQEEVNGTLRWKLNEQSCFDYWGKIGTDCNVCMRVCPWAHARTFPHKFIVAAVSRNRFSRYLFNVMDDIVYGKKPKAKNPPEWARF